MYVCIKVCVRERSVCLHGISPKGKHYWMNFSAVFRTTLTLSCKNPWTMRKFFDFCSLSPSLSLSHSLSLSLSHTPTHTHTHTYTHSVSLSIYLSHFITHNTLQTLGTRRCFSTSRDSLSLELWFPFSIISEKNPPTVRRRRLWVGGHNNISRSKKYSEEFKRLRRKKCLFCILVTWDGKIAAIIIYEWRGYTKTCCEPFAGQELCRDKLLLLYNYHSVVWKDRK